MYLGSQYGPGLDSILLSSFCVVAAWWLQRFLFYVDYAKAVESSEDSGERLPDFVPSPEANLLLSRFKEYAMSQRA